MSSGCVAITGANGLVGRSLCAHFLACGWTVRALVRRPEATPPGLSAASVHVCDLPDEVDLSGLRDCSAIVHCAYATRHVSPSEASRVNISGTQRLLEAAAEVGRPPLVFVSSVSARRDALSFYGRSKYAVEGLLNPARDLAVRPGLVLAAHAASGLFPRMMGWVRRGGLVPLVDGGHQIVQTVLVADLADAILRAVERRMTGCILVADPTGMELRALLQMAAAETGSKCRFFSVRSRPLVAALKLAEAARVPLPVSSENVLGLLTMRFQDPTPDLVRLGISIPCASDNLRRVFAELHRVSDRADGGPKSG